MKNVLVIILIFLIGIIELKAQKSNICGTITDDLDIPIQFASVSLLNIADSTLITGTSSNEMGAFCVENFSGNYIIRFSSIGYNVYYMDITLNDDLILHNVKLQDDNYLLDEVVIKSNKPTIKRTADKFIVSVESSHSLQNKTLDKILNVSPGVFIGKDGELSLNGIGGVGVIINNKIIRLSGTQLISYLKSVQGADLKDIEIISNPTSHYESEGVGGIIRINTKKIRNDGFTGYISSDYTQHKYALFDEGIGLGYSNNQFTIYGNYNYSYEKVYAKRYTTDFSEESNLLYNSQESYIGSRIDHVYKVGLDWDILENHYLGIEYNGLNNLSKDPYGETSTEIFNNSNYSGKILSETPIRYTPKNNLFNFNYVWKIDSLGQELKVIGDYSDVTDNDETYYHNDYYNSSNEITDNISKRQNSDEKITIYSAQVDYFKRISDKIKYSAGIKYSNVRTKYQYSFFNKDTSNGNYVIDDKFSDNFKYNEERYAAYLNFDYKTKKFETNIGIRAEYTDTKGISYVLNEENKDNYWKIFPSTLFKYKIDNNHGLIFYYGARIRRPDYSLVNPFVLYLTELSVKKGNPSLKPSIMHVIEATYALKDRCYFALKANFQNKAFSPFSYRENDITISTTENLSHIDYYYFNAYVPVNLGLWESYYNLNIGFTENKQNKQTVTSFNMNFSSRNYFMLTDDFGLEFNTTFQPRSKSFYEKNYRSFLKMDIAFDYTFLNDKINFNLSIVDIINARGKRRKSFHYDDLYRTEIFRSDGRALEVGFRYNFNSGKAVRQKNKTKSNMDEMNRI